MTTNLTTTIISSNNTQSLERLTELAEFWKIPHTRQMETSPSDPVFCSGKVDVASRSNHPTIISPSGREDAMKIASEYGLEVRRREATLTLPVKPGQKVSLQTIINEFQGSRLEPIISSEDDTRVLSRIEGTQIYLLPIDIVREYERRLYGGVEDSPSTRFKLISKLPLPYSIVPSSIRDWSLRRSVNENQSVTEPATVDFLRLLFIASLAKTSEKPIPCVAFWEKGKTYSMAVTHDIETSQGLNRGTEQLLRIEKDVNIRSTWNIPSDRYKLHAKTLSQLGQEGDIGAHDTRHDGRLILVSLAEKISRARQAKEKLERLSGTSVSGFRAPLLQHSRDLISAVAMAGYEYDSSVPAWEMVSPTSSKPHGAGTVFPFQFGGVWEVPVSLPQDHQLVRVRQLSTSVATKVTLKTASHIKAIGGACILLVHPDYDYAYPENEQDYRLLIEAFTQDEQCAVVTMKELVTWWKLRNESRIDISTTTPRIVSGPQYSTHSGLQIETISGYSQNGLVTSTLD